MGTAGGGPGSGGGLALSGTGAAADGSDLNALCAEVALLGADPRAEAAAELAARLEHPSWYLRERVVAALGAREDGAAEVLGVLRRGAWWARASACDVLGRRADLSCTEDLLSAVEASHVSLQKSAVRALEAVAERAGQAFLAERIARLEPDRRRRILARIGHQAPAWAAALHDALAAVPAASFTAEPEGAPRVPVPEDAEVRVLVRFRRWLRSSGPGSRPKSGRAA